VNIDFYYRFLSFSKVFGEGSDLLSQTFRPASKLGLLSHSV
jgi:hypothetical protein